MSKYFTLFAWEIFIRDLSLALINGWVCPKLAERIHEMYNNLIKEASESIDTIISSLNLPIHALYTPIAKDYVLYNSKPYEGEVINAKM